MHRYHRQTLVDRLGVSDGEPEFVARILAMDGKNYHAWSYRCVTVEPTLCVPPENTGLTLGVRLPRHARTHALGCGCSHGSRRCGRPSWTTLTA